MNSSILHHLVLKDWYLHRAGIIGAMGLGAIALLLIGVNSKTAFYVGSILLITAVIGVGIYLVFMTTIQEKKDKTLPFVMSLPISARQYTRAKLLANLLIFILPWSIFMTATIVVIAARETLPNGLIPLAVLSLTEIFAAFSLLLGIALVTESEGWTITALVVGNLSFNFFLYFVSQIPSIGPHIEGPIAVWSPAVFWVLFVEIVTIVLTLGLTFYFQGRKKDFIF